MLVLARRCSAPHLGHDAPVLPELLDGVLAALQHLGEGLQDAVAHGGGAADEDAAVHLLDPVLYGHLLLADRLLHVLALLAIAGPREGGVEHSERPLRPHLHFRQRAAGVVLNTDGAAHLLPEEPVLLGVTAAEEERRGRLPGSALQLLPEPSEGGDAGARADHDNGDVLLRQVEGRGALLGQDLVAGLQPSGKPGRSLAEEAPGVLGRELRVLGEAAHVAELLQRLAALREAVAGQADAEGDLGRSGLGRRRDRELPGLLPGAVQEEGLQGPRQARDAEQAPELVHLAAEGRGVQQLQRVGVREDLRHVLCRLALQLRLHGLEHLLRGGAGQVAVPGEGLAERARRREGPLDLRVRRPLLRREGDGHLQVGRLHPQEGHAGLDVSGVALWQHGERAAERVVLQLPRGLELDLGRGEALLRVRLLAQLPDLRDLRLVGLEVELAEHLRGLALALGGEGPDAVRHLQLRGAEGQVLGGLLEPLLEALLELGAEPAEQLLVRVLEVQAALPDAARPDLLQRLHHGLDGAGDLGGDRVRVGALARVAVLRGGHGQHREAEGPELRLDGHGRIAELSRDAGPLVAQAVPVALDREDDLLLRARGGDDSSQGGILHHGVAARPRVRERLAGLLGLAAGAEDPGLPRRGREAGGGLRLLLLRDRPARVLRRDLLDGLLERLPEAAVLPLAEVGLDVLAVISDAALVDALGADEVKADVGGLAHVVELRVVHVSQTHHCEALPSERALVPRVRAPLVELEGVVAGLAVAVGGDHEDGDLARLEGLGRELLQIYDLALDAPLGGLIADLV
mmetsp:Transcript_48328/g.142616  ORF Transcript_48328/g.142616 Transcript_48328/m.142616 type:complete len:802 (+) Transcript_48328:294-2699(+)